MRNSSNWRPRCKTKRARLCSAAIFVQLTLLQTNESHFKNEMFKGGHTFSYLPKLWPLFFLYQLLWVKYDVNLLTFTFFLFISETMELKRLGFDFYLINSWSMDAFEPLIKSLHTFIKLIWNKVNNFQHVCFVRVINRLCFLFMRF